MQIVVTGAAGFIGSHTCEALVAAGHRVIGVDAFDSYLYPAEVKRGTAAVLARMPREKFSMIEADICDEAVMERICDAPKVDVVCHLAALAGVPIDRRAAPLRTHQPVRDHLDPRGDATRP